MRYGLRWRLTVVCVLTLFAAIFGGIVKANAQSTPPPDLAFMQAAIDALEQQRNNAANQHANAEARVRILTDQVARLQALVTELQKTSEVKPPPKEGGQ